MSWSIRFEHPKELVAGAEFGGGIYKDGLPSGFPIDDWMDWSYRLLQPGDPTASLSAPEISPGDLVGSGFSDTNLSHTTLGRDVGGRFKSAPVGSRLVLAVGVNPDGTNRHDLPQELRGHNYIIYEVVESRPDTTGELREAATKNDIDAAVSEIKSHIDSKF